MLPLKSRRSDDVGESGDVVSNQSVSSNPDDESILAEQRHIDTEMRAILEKPTDELVGLPRPTQDVLLAWLESSHVQGSSELRAAIIERRELLKRSRELQEQIYQTRKRRAAQFGPLGNLIFYLANRSNPRHRDK